MPESESHIVFFSYARESLDPYLEDFFKHLSDAIQPYTFWPQGNEHIIFRDKSNLRFGENWKSHIQGALQVSSVLVCMTCVAYFSKEFCGKEYYFFDQRRRQGVQPNQDPPPVIFPVIWAPVAGDPVVGEMPQYLKDLQQVPKGIPDSYLALGLRRLRKQNSRKVYQACVDAFADAIVAAWRQHSELPPLKNVLEFDEVPNMFEGGDWQEAAGPQGWLPGAEVANFVFVAKSRNEAPAPPGRHGKAPREWRPYLPPERTTVLDEAKNAAKTKFKFREIQVSDKLPEQLKSANERRNLSLVIGDPGALPLESFQAVRAIEDLWWDGMAMLLPCDESIVKWDDDALQKALKSAFPTLFPHMPPNVRGPIRSIAELRATLELILNSMRTAVNGPQIQERPPNDDPPPSVNGTGGSRP